MAGPGEGEIQPIKAGNSAQPLILTSKPGLTGDAVDRLVNAFRNGALNTQDVIDRIGETAQAQKKAKLQALQEYVSPGAIQSRMAAYQAAGAQSDLATAQANAAAGLVKPQTQLAGTKISKEQAELEYGPTGAQAFDQYARWFHEAVPTTSDGAVDFKEKVRRGNEMATQMGAAQYWLDLLTPVKQEKIEVAPGITELHEFNRLGIDVTAPNPQFNVPGSDAYKSYLKRVQEFLPEGHPLYGKFLPAPFSTGERTGMPDNPPPNPHSISTLL